MFHPILVLTSTSDASTQSFHSANPFTQAENVPLEQTEVKGAPVYLVIARSVWLILCRSCVVSTFQSVSYHDTTPLWHGPLLEQEDVNLAREHRVRWTRGQRYVCSDSVKEIRID